MAEIAGVVASCITIAGVVKLCIEALEIVQSGKRQDYEFEMLAIRLEIEKARLYTWGQSLGLADTNASTDKGPLESFLFKTLVKASLLQLKELLEGSDSLQQRYGCEQAEPSTSEPGTAVAHSAAVFDNFTIGLLIKPAVSKFRNRTRWIIRDGKRFKILVGEIETLVSNLHGRTKTLVPVQEYASTILSKLEEIKDPSTLDATSEVCLEDHRDLADAASALSERRTNVTTQSQATQGIGPQSQKPIYTTTCNQWRTWV